MRYNSCFNTFFRFGCSALCGCVLVSNAEAVHTLLTWAELRFTEVLTIYLADRFLFAILGNGFAFNLYGRSSRILQILGS